MADQPSRRLPIGVVAGIALLVIGTGSATAWWTWRSAQPPIESVQPSDSSPQPETSKSPVASTAPTIAPSHSSSPNPDNPGASPQTSTLQVYWLKTSANQIELVPSPVQLSAQSSNDTLLKQAVGQLLSGTTQASLGTTIPSQTKLLSLSIQPDGIHIDLSKEFSQGGGSTSMTARIGQLLYTVTSLQPDTPVWLSVEGKALETLGGEGLLVDQPITRASFARDFVLQ